MPIIYQGSSVVETKKEKLYAVIASGNVALLNSLLNDPVYQFILSEMTFSPSVTAINTIISSQTALNIVVNSQIAMNAIANSQTAMNAVINSSTALNAVINSQTAMNAIVNSQTALNAVVNSPTAMNAIANSQTALNVIQSVASARQAFVNSTALPQRSVPTMTSNTTPEGQAIGSSFSGSGYEYFRAFDKQTATSWYSVSGLPQWIGYVFSEPVFVHQVRITASNWGLYENPTSITIQYSSDGSTWQNVATYNQQFTSAEAVLNIPLRAGFYRYWRVLITNTVYGPSSSTHIRELNFIGFAQQ